MKNTAIRLLLSIGLIAAAGSPVFAQGGSTSSSLTGVVVDQTGAVIPGAEIAARNNATGYEAKAVSAEDGGFTIPFLPVGTYTVTVSLPGFKTWVARDVVLQTGTPSSLKVTLEVGSPSDTIVVEAAAELLQSSTATITTTLNVTQISSLPVGSRSVMEYLIFLPGANTTGSTRDTNFVGLPQSTINITIDGINVQDNYLKGAAGGDGYFAIVSPRMDAIQEVTVSTATPGSEAAGQGAIQIKFTTRQGSNEYHGSFYEYHRNSWLNANTWFNNRDLTPVHKDTGLPCGTPDQPYDPKKCKAPRNPSILNQYGFRLGGPIRLPKALFGPLGFDGRDRAFFFINLEESRQPFAQSRTRTIFNPLIDQGIFPYQVGSEIRTVNLLQLAAAKGQTATWDPTIQKLLADIRKVSGEIGTVKQQTRPDLMDYFIQNRGIYVTKMPTTRFDFNITANHRIEWSWMFMKYVPSPDTTNSRDWMYPGFPSMGTQGSNRWSTSIGLRSTFTPRLTNELRLGAQAYTVLFSPETNISQFKDTPIGNQDGYALSLSPISNAHSGTTQSRRNDPIKIIEDNLSWSRGSHNLSFGGTFTNVGHWGFSKAAVPVISFGVDTTYDPGYVLFDTASGPINFPGASSTQRGYAQAIYALMTGRVTQISGTAVLNEKTLKYTYLGPNVQRGRMREFGFYVADSWRVRPGLTLNLGLRWELQLPFVPLNDVYTYNTVEDLWGISGYGNLFKPGVMTGQEPTYKQLKKGTRVFNIDYRSFAPSFGFAWSPRAREGWLGRLLGSGGQTVFRGGYSIAYTRNGMYDYTNRISGNPGLTVSATRNVANGNLVTGSETWPLLFRDKNRLGPASFAETPVYPLKSTSISDEVNIFDPNLRTPYTQSWSFGIQRELTKSMVLEVRYIGNRHLQEWSSRDLNEQNLVENGFLDEFRAAMGNLQANIAAGRGANFRYYGPGTGTSPLPITLAYFSKVPPSQAGDQTKYTSTLFASSTFVNALVKTNPAPGSFATSLWNDATRRSNALAAGLPANIFVVNPTVHSGGPDFTTNGGFTSYNALTIELRRRMARGLLVQANYTFAKGLQSSRVSFRVPYVKVLSDTLPHAFKANWVYELPFGRGRMFANSLGTALDRIVGGWEFQGITRIQSGNLLNFGNVRLVGMTPDELRKAVGLRFDDANKQVYYEPEDIRINTIAAYNTDATKPNGYSTAWGVPTGRYVAPANSGDCLQVYSGQCAPLTLYVRGPKFWNFDLSLVKRAYFTEQANFELRGEFLNAFNNVNFNGTTCASASATCGQVTSTNGTARRIQIVLRLNF